MSHFEEIEVGARRTLGSHTFTREEIIAFAQKYDPQPFHLDDEAASRTHFGSLVASGWHTAAMWMKCFVADRTHDAKARAGRGEPAVPLGPSPGFRNLRWLKPVYAGDTLTYATEVRAKSPSKSRPGWGLLTAYNSGVNQHGDLVIDFESTVFVPRRG
ncbi:MaoC family dehydratase [Aquabacter spiritensis]|uniref:Acyl dehydratase n=1 Tax=Aquabacter spiritensis TaxID=933073 RepID=A0A4R3M4J6_9HYPH|nr:MaoC family dehydratase [Aquabacter spiritensis]TCT07766.1 acyl dehydratase [Aquabacter spiritensis]